MVAPDALGIAPIGKTGRKPLGDAEPALDLAQEHDAAVRRKPPAVATISLPETGDRPGRRSPSRRRQSSSSFALSAAKLAARGIGTK